MIDTYEEETALIGALCIDVKTIHVMTRHITPETFTLDSCRAVYECALERIKAGKKFDPLIAADLLSEKIPDVRKFLAECMEVVPTTANTEEYAEILRRKSEERTLRERVAAALETESGESLTSSIAVICTEQIQARPTSRAVQMRDALESAYRALWDKEPFRVDTGYGRLDRLLKGLHAGELVLLGARPSVGKSAFGLSIVEAAAKRGHHVALFSLEMLADEISERMMARHTKTATLDNLIDRPLPESMGEDVAQAMCAAAELSITIFDSPRLTVSRMRAQALTVPNLSLVVVDYLGLLSSERRFDSRYAEMTEISRGLKNLAVELRVPVLALSQLNREKGAAEKPTLRDLRDSGSLEQDANKVMLLWNVDEAAHIVGCSVAKNRRGRTGEVHFKFDGDHMNFSELDRLHAEPHKREKNSLPWDEPAQVELAEVAADGREPF